jgi:quinohemoprotein ethanol dehydrogenase
MRAKSLLAGLLLTLAACAPQAGRVDSHRVRHAKPGDWLMGGRTFAADHHSPLSQIDAANVGRLGLAFEFRDFLVRGRTHHGMEANPIEVDGALYFSGPWGVAYAVDARTGRLIWRHDPNGDGQYGRFACCDVVSRGVAVWKGRVYSASLDGYLTALDARTGKRIWSRNAIVDRHWNTTITGAPHIAGNNVLIGSAGADMGSRGYVSAFDLRSGKLAWRFWSVPGDPKAGPDETGEVALARSTWSQDTRWDLGMGGNAWDSMAYDPELNIAYLGIGNGGPHPQWVRSRERGHDDYYLSSIVAVNASNGHIRWVYQTTPGDSWDFAATQHLMLAELTIGGRRRKVIMQAPKNGFFYVLDRKTGELLKADAYTTVNWASGVDMKTGRPRLTPEADYSQGPKIIWPSPAGGHSWQPMSFDPATALVYLPVYDAPMKRTTLPVPAFRPGAYNHGFRGAFPPFTAPEDLALLKGQPEPKMETRLKAWDPVAGRVAWMSAPLPFVSGGVLTTGSGLLFEGSTDGMLTVYDSRTGAVLRRIETGSAIMAAPISYMLDGVQYIAVLAGAGGPQNPRWSPEVIASRRQNFERLLVFKLGGGPVPLPPLLQPEPLQPPPAPIAADPAALERGRRLFEAWCGRCHVEGGATGAYPNLWNMPPTTLDAFEDIVYRGAMRYAGMGDFSDVLSAKDVAAIKAFIVNDTIARRRQGDQR